MKLPVTGGLRVRTYDVLARAVEEGVALGWRRAHKHDPSPAEHVIAEHVTRHVIDQICEVFDCEEQQP